MCWKSKYTPNMLVAHEDVPVFKIGYTWLHNVVLGYFFREMKYEKGGKYEERGIQPFFNNESFNCFIITQGLHSYSTNNIRFKTALLHEACGCATIPCVEITSNKIDLQENRLFHRQLYNIAHSALMLCIIPKGAVYYINEAGEIVSDHIEVKEIYIKPFKAIGGEICETSVNNVNKILDNWEKGII